MCGLALAPPAPLLAARPAPAEVGLRLVATAPARSPEYLPVAPSLAEVGLYSSAQLMAIFAAKKPEIDPWIEDAEINGDRNLRPQYLAGLGATLYEADPIYRTWRGSGRTRTGRSPDRGSGWRSCGWRGTRGVSDCPFYPVSAAQPPVCPCAASARSTPSRASASQLR